MYARIARADPGGYERLVRRLVRAVLGDDPIDPTHFCPSDVVQFVTAMRGPYSVGSMGVVRTALRSFFRFLRAEGLCDARLEAAVPTVAYWRLAALPRQLTDEQLDRVLSSVELSKPYGHRNRAILLCLTTLALRPSEVADVCLEDIDWHAGTIQLRSRKNRRAAVLPLPCNVGQAIVDYLREERPETANRRVFVQHGTPRRGAPISRNSVSHVAVRALRRAGIERPLGGAYVFRHTVASRMVQQGATLKEVADLLGHRSIDTTAIYAKLDLPRLREVARSWPEVIA